MSVLEGGVAVVTGGAGTGAGLGEGLVRRLGAEGMRVAILDVDEAAAAHLAEQLVAKGIHALSCRVDLRDPATLLTAAERVREAFDGCNVLCAHAGAGLPGRIDAIPLEQWRETFEVMVHGTIATVNAFLPLIRETSGMRRIVLTSSAAALAPGRFQGPYRAAKAAVTSVGETLDLELEPEGIGTTIVFPSGMATEDALAAQRAGGTEAATRGLPDEWREIATALGEEMAPDPRDLTTGLAAAEPVVEAIKTGHRYVVTHGFTLEQVHRERQALLDDAFADLRRRDYETRTEAVACTGETGVAPRPAPLGRSGPEGT